VRNTEYRIQKKRRGRLRVLGRKKVCPNIKTKETTQKMYRTPLIPRLLMEYSTMHRKKAFTLIELVVVISIIALLITILMPTMSKARGQGTGSVCLSNQKTMTSAWIMYADGSNDRLCFGSVHEFNSHNPNASSDLYRRRYSWVHPPLKSMDVIENPHAYAARDTTTWDDRVRGMEAGVLFKYINTIEPYHCPGDKRNVKNEAPRDIYRSYSISHGVSGHSTWSHIKLSTIRQPSSKHIFIEEYYDGTGRYAYNPSGWALPFYELMTRWQDPVAIWHNKRSTLGFADGHAEMHGWLDQRTFEYTSGILPGWQPNNPDLEYMRRDYPHLILADYIWITRTY